MTEFKVGQRWLTRGHEIAKITAVLYGDDSTWPIIARHSSDGFEHSHTNRGRLYPESESPLDLIELLAGAS